MCIQCWQQLSLCDCAVHSWYSHASQTILQQTCTQLITTSTPASSTDHICSELSFLGQRSLITTNFDLDNQSQSTSIWVMSRRERIKKQLQKLGYRCVTSLVPRPLLFLPSICIHMQECTGAEDHFRVLLWKVKTGEVWERGYRVWQWGNSLIVTSMLMRITIHLSSRCERIPRQFWRYNVKAQFAQLIDNLFSLDKW